MEQFVADMGQPKPGTSINRKDNNGNYSCGHCDECLSNGWIANCEWATAKTQSNNTRRNRILICAGIKQTLSQWAECLGFSPDAIAMRLSRRWTIDQALRIPLGGKRG